MEPTQENPMVARVEEGEYGTVFGSGVKPSQRQVFTTGAVARLCNVAPRTVSKWFDSGRLKGYRIPGSMDRRIPRAQLIAFLKESGLPVPEELDDTPQLRRVLFVGIDETLAGRMSDLTVEDSPRVLYFAADLFAAGTLAREHRPDSIVVDLSVGRSEALALAKRVRDDEQAAERQTLLVALLGEDATLSENPWPYDCEFQKPFDPALLAERLRRGRE